MKYSIYFEPMGYCGDFEKGTRILDCAIRLKIEITNICGGKGNCGKCLIQVMEGEISPITESEQQNIRPQKLKQGFRLACEARLLSNCRIRVPTVSLSSLQRIQVEGLELPVKFGPTCVRGYLLNLLPPSLTKVNSDFENLAETMEKQYDDPLTTSDFEVLHSISTVLRKENWSVRAIVRGSELISMRNSSAPLLGMAIDLGTTKIAAYLLDLDQGKTIDVKGVVNPQIGFGGDIISRMTASVHSPENMRELQAAVVETINNMADLMCKDVQAEPWDIGDIVMVGNTAMCHLFLGLPVQQLCMAPYVSVANSSLDVKARELGLKSALGAYVHIFPSIAGYVGGDHVAMILSENIHKKQGVVLGIDIGTNTEIVLSKNQALRCVSCASGPAFEGANIEHGMRIANGAIEHFCIIDNRIEYQTVGNTPAIGICGSGIIDIVAQLYLKGIIDKSGRLQKHVNVRDYGGAKEFVVFYGKGDHTDISITQKDIREIQLAKGAIQAGIQVLLESAGVEENDIGEIIIAGAFGTYIDIQNAITIGMLPDLPLKRFRQVGNAAGMGAKMALLSKTKRNEAQNIAHQVQYIELASYPGFSKIFAKATELG